MHLAASLESLTEAVVSVVIIPVVVPSVGVKGIASEFILVFFLILFLALATVVVSLGLVFLYLFRFLQVEGGLEYVPRLLHVPVFLYIYCLRIVVDVVGLYGYQYLFPY